MWRLLTLCTPHEDWKMGIFGCSFYCWMTNAYVVDIAGTESRYGLSDI